MTTKIPAKVMDRFNANIAQFQKVLQNAYDRDVNESDTVTIVKDMLASVMGFDKYEEVTSEYSIRGTYCDLATKLDGSVRYLIEVKAIGLALKENHLRQVVSYGSSQGVPWVVLTNGITWEVYRIKFEQPVSHEFVFGLNFLELNTRKCEDMEKLFLLCREGVQKSAIDDFHAFTQIVNRFTIAAIVTSDPVLTVIRRELQRLEPNSRVTTEDISAILPDVLKRDVTEGDEAVAAQKRVSKATKIQLRKRSEKSADCSEGAESDDEMPDATGEVDTELLPGEEN
jgi:hypothetical protein